MNSAATVRREYDALGQMIHPWINFLRLTTPVIGIRIQNIYIEQ